MQLAPVNVYYPQTVKQKDGLWDQCPFMCGVEALVNILYWLSITSQSSLCFKDFMEAWMLLLYLKVFFTVGEFVLFYM